MNSFKEEKNAIIWQPSESVNISLACGKELTGIIGNDRKSIKRMKERLEQRLPTVITKFDKETQEFIRESENMNNDLEMLGYLIEFYIPLLLGWGSKNKQSGRFVGYIVYFHYHENMFDGWSRLTVVDRAKAMWRYCPFLFDKHWDEQYVIGKYQQVHTKLREGGFLQWKKDELELTLDKKYNLDKIDDALVQVINRYYERKYEVQQDYVDNRKRELIERFNDAIIQDETYVPSKEELQKIETYNLDWRDMREINHILRNEIGYNINNTKKKYRMSEDLDDEREAKVELICDLLEMREGYIFRAIAQDLHDNRKNNNADKKLRQDIERMKQKAIERARKSAW